MLPFQSARVKTVSGGSRDQGFEVEESTTQEQADAVCNDRTVPRTGRTKHALLSQATLWKSQMQI